MADLTGDTGWLSTLNSAITQKLAWRITNGSSTANTSTVECLFYLKKDPSIQNAPTFSSDARFTMTVAGQTYKEEGVYKEVPADNKEHLIIAKAFTVAHNSDGSKSATFSVTGGLGGTTIYYYSINTSRTVTFPKIARASEIDSAAKTTLGNACSIKWTPGSTSFYYKLKFSIGSWKYTTSAIHPNQTTQYTYSGYTIPLTVANQITDATTGTMTATLYTYSNSACTSSLGTKTKTFTVVVPSTVIPTLSDYTLTPVNSNSVISGWGINVSGYTKFNLSASASGIYNSTISNFVISGAYSKTVTGTSLNYTGSAVSGSGTKKFTLMSVDSRGRKSTAQTLTATVYAYSKPSISNLIIERNTDNQTSINIQVNCSYSSCNGNNSITIVLKYKKQSDSSYTTYSGDTITRNTTQTIALGVEEDSSYDFIVTVTDALGNIASTTTSISTSQVLLDFRQGGRGLGIGKMTESDALEIALDTYFFGDVYINGVLLETYIQNIISST